MADVSLQIETAGLRELHRALKQAEPQLQKQLSRDLKDAAEIVAAEARSRVPSRTGRAAASIRSGSAMKGAYVAGGKGSVKYYGWLDFGSRTPVSGNARSVGPWKGSGQGPKQGRFIYPALTAKRDEVLAVVERAVEKSIKEAGFE